MRDDVRLVIVRAQGRHARGARVLDIAILNVKGGIGGPIIGLNAAKLRSRLVRHYCRPIPQD